MGGNRKRGLAVGGHCGPLWGIEPGWISPISCTVLHPQCFSCAATLRLLQHMDLASLRDPKVQPVPLDAEASMDKARAGASM